MLLTSLTDPMDIIQGLECGADNFITKPYHGEDLVSRVQSILENISQRSEGKIKIEAAVAFMGRPGHQLAPGTNPQPVDLHV